MSRSNSKSKIRICVSIWSFVPRGARGGKGVGGVITFTPEGSIPNWSAPNFWLICMGGLCEDLGGRGVCTHLPRISAPLLAPPLSCGGGGHSACSSHYSGDLCHPPHPRHMGRSAHLDPIGRSQRVCVSRCQPPLPRSGLAGPV